MRLQEQTSARNNNFVDERQNQHGFVHTHTWGRIGVHAGE